MYDSPNAEYAPPDELPAERTVPLRTFDSIPAEQTAQLCIAGLWQWPDTDPDNHPKIIMEARAALRSCECPTLPVLESVLAGLRNLVPH